MSNQKELDAFIVRAGFTYGWRNLESWARRMAEQAVEELEKANTVPEGWKLVPVEPTDAMLTEVDEEVGGSCYSCSKWNASHDDCQRVYAAMLSAAPTPGEKP